MTRAAKDVARVLLVVIAVAVVALSGASDVRAQQAAGTLGQKIQGSWTLVSIVNEQDGKKIDVFGPNPRGFLSLTPDGHFSMTILRASLPKVAAINRMKGTAEENQAIVQGSIAYFGKYSVTSEKDKTMALSIEGSTFPNWDGEVQKRIISITGDELTITNPTPSIGGGTNYVVWKRTK
jgi:hypothetical protein